MLDELRKLRFWVENHGWCQGPIAKDILGNPVYSDDPDAASFCLLGSLKRAVDKPMIGKVYTLINNHVVNLDYKNLVFFNEAKGRTKEDIIKLLDVLIEKEAAQLPSQL